MSDAELEQNQSRPREAMARYAGETYIQHNPGVGAKRCIEDQQRYEKPHARPSHPRS